MKRILRILIGLSLVLAECSAPRKEREWKDASLKAYITSDLHLSVDPAAVASIVPAMPYGKEIAEAIADQVIDAHPDVFIMTGDNTNSGSITDMEVLKEILQRIKDAGIKVIMTTGNHDFNQCTPQQYWDCFEELFDEIEKDPASLSYITEIGNVRIFAMDDNYADGGATGTFSADTMRWLKEHLKRAADEGKTILFASHHNVIAGPSGDRSTFYQITNADLKQILKDSGVTLCLSGHQHGQGIQEENGLYEIISSMPLSGSHQIGSLTIRNRTADYITVPVDFETYGSSDLKTRIAEADEKEQEVTADIFSNLLKQEGLSGSDYDGVMNLIGTFFSSYSAGTLADDALKIKADPYYQKMTDALRTHNYGPWMENVLENPPMAGNRLHLEW